MGHVAMGMGLGLRDGAGEGTCTRYDDDDDVDDEGDEEEEDDKDVDDEEDVESVSAFSLCFKQGQANSPAGPLGPVKCSSLGMNFGLSTHST